MGRLGRPGGWPGNGGHLLAAWSVRGKGVAIVLIGGYNGLEVICMNPVQKAIKIIENLPTEKLYAAIYVLELIAGEDKTKSEDMLALKAFEMACEEEELTPDEMAQIAEGEREIKAGLGVKAEDVWKKLGI